MSSGCVNFLKNQKYKKLKIHKKSHCMSHASLVGVTWVSGGVSVGVAGECVRWVCEFSKFSKIQISKITKSDILCQMSY